MDSVSAVINSLISPSTPDAAALPREILILELNRCEKIFLTSKYNYFLSTQAFMKLVNDCKEKLESFPEPIDKEKLRDYTPAVRDLATEFEQLDHALNREISSSVCSQEFDRCLLKNINRHEQRFKSLKEFASRSDTPPVPASSSSGNQTTSYLPTPGMFGVRSLVLYNPVNKDKYLKIDLLRRYINASNSNQSCSRWRIPGQILNYLSDDFSSFPITATCSETLKLLINGVDNASYSYADFSYALNEYHLSALKKRNQKYRRRSKATTVFVNRLTQENTTAVLDKAIADWQDKVVMS